MYGICACPTSPRLQGKDPQFERMSGPTLTPGDYTLTLHIGDESQTQPLTLIKDATSSASDRDLQKQFDLMMQIYDLYSEATETLNTMRRLRGQLNDLAERLSAGEDHGEISERAAALSQGILEIEKGIFIPDLPEGWAGRVNQGTDPMRRLSALPSVVGLGEFPPTEQSYAVFEKLSGIIRGRLDEFESKRSGEIAAFNRALVEQGIGAVG